MHSGTHLQTLLLGFGFAAVALAAPAPTYHKDVAPILQRNCQGLPPAGRSGADEFLNLQGSAAVRQGDPASVAQRRMPPWNADPHVGIRYANDRSLQESEIATLNAWVAAGAPEGNPKDAPAPKQFAEGWSIGQPDVVLEMPTEFRVPAQGTVEYHYVVLPTNFKQDMGERRGGPPDESRGEPSHHCLCAGAGQ